MTGAPDANLFEIVQTRDFVVIHSEKYHDARIVRMQEAKGDLALMPHSWLGESIGHWEGDTLVVATTGLKPGVTSRGQRLYLSGASQVIERFKRTGPDEIYYEFVVEDPEMFTRPWRGEMTIRSATGRIYEYACHEGNYGLANILHGAREAERRVLISTKP